MLGNQNYASRVNSALEWKFILTYFVAHFSIDFEVSFLFLIFTCHSELFETFRLRQIKKLEENNHRLASALASAISFLTRLLSLLFIYSGKRNPWNPSDWILWLQWNRALAARSTFLFPVIHLFLLVRWNGSWPTFSSRKSSKDIITGSPGNGVSSKGFYGIKSIR